MVEAWPGGHGSADGGPDRPGREDDGSLGARSLFGTPPSILSCLHEEGEDTDAETDRFWIIDEVAQAAWDAAYWYDTQCMMYRMLQARHLIATFGGRGIRDWHRCKRDGGCRDERCICRYVQDGVDHYGDWAAPISDVLASVASMADDECMASDTDTTVSYHEME